MRTSENSSDLERAAAARSIAVEFLEVRMAIEKLQRCENQYFSRSRCTFWDPDSVTSVMRENVLDEGDGHVIDDTSSGGLRFHVALDRHEIEVPAKFSYHVTSTRDGQGGGRHASASSTASSTSSCPTTTTSAAAGAS